MAARRDRPKPTPQSPSPEGFAELVRLNKYLAERGVASRRKCDELIAGGQVSVDGEVVTELGTRVDSATARVEVGGEVLKAERRPRYYLLNKPKGVVCTNEQREARPRAIDLIGDPDRGRIYTVGRLDEQSEGLILLTSDGEFAQRIAHPRHGVRKTYLVKLRGKVDGPALEKIRKGVHLAEGRTGGARARVIKRTSQFTVLEVTIAEGRNREVRRIFADVGYKVQSLRRVRIGHLSDRRLKPGQWRPLVRAEVRDLLALTEPGATDDHDDDVVAGPRVYPAPGARKQHGKRGARKTPAPRGRRFGPRAAQSWARQGGGGAGRPRGGGRAGRG